MRKILISSLVFLGFVMFSCEDYLSVDKYFNDMLTFDTVWVKKSYTEGWLNNVYTTMNDNGQELSQKGQGALQWASDDYIYSDNLFPSLTINCREYQNCEYTASSQLSENRWGRLYQGIRKASIFIHNVDKCEELSMIERDDLKGQARFLRAYFYYMLMKQYGPVPILDGDNDKGLDVNETYENLSIARAKYDYCVDYVENELLTASRNLPVSRSSVEFGRPSQGAAMALRAKVLLFAASPLYNGNEDMFALKNAAGEPLINPEYSEYKWAKAAAAAKEVIDSGLYELFTVSYDVETTLPLADNVPADDYPNGAGDIDPLQSYAQIFNGEVNGGNISEIIWGRAASGTINDILRHQMPNLANAESWNCYAATFKQVDAYYMANGMTTAEAAQLPDTDPYHYTNKYFTTSALEAPPVGAGVNYMFVNREPRFYASIAYPGTIWENSAASDNSGLKNSQVFYYRNSLYGKNPADPRLYVMTGMGVRKWYNPEETFEKENNRTYTKNKVAPTIRYADLLLWYAEALNELTTSHVIPADRRTEAGKGEITVSRDVDEIRYALSRIRFRAGLPDFADATYNSHTQLRTAIKRERQIELFAEGPHRYFDLRRWKDAPVEESKPIMGLDVDMTDSSTTGQRDAFYNVVAVKDMPKIWLDKMYLWPIPTNELRRNAKLIQNPGW